MGLREGEERLVPSGEDDGWWLNLAECADMGEVGQSAVLWVSIDLDVLL